MPDMGRNLSPLVQEELEKLEKDAESRRLAMKALKSYATNIDTKAIPQFLAQVSETSNQGSPSGECTISLFEVLARVHGRNIVPHIGSIMNTIIRTLSTSAGSFPLHQACSRVVPAIARYGIDPSTPDDEKNKIIQSLTMPLSNALMSPHESLASGSALCLKVLVESNNWKFASDDTVNDVCLKVAGALEEKTTQTNSHMGLAMALAKHNSSIVEAYVGSLIRSGLHLLSIGTSENNSQKRFAAIQMINFLIKCIDSRSISSELFDVADAMEKCQADHMAYVRGAAFEALQTAKAVASQKGSKCDLSSTPVNYLNFHRRNEKSPQVPLYKLGKESHVEFPTPESQSITSSIKNENFTVSPSSIKHTHSNTEYIGKHAQRRLWSDDLGGVDLSFKDSFLLKPCPSSNLAENVKGQQARDDQHHQPSRADNQHAESFTPESQSIASSIKNENFTVSPSSIKHSHSNSEYIGKHAQRGLWSNDLGGVDLSFKDSFLLKPCPSSNIAENVEGQQARDDMRHQLSRADDNQHAESFTGFVLSNVGNTESRDSPPGPQLLQSSQHQLLLNDIKMYATPRKLVRSLQNQSDSKRELSAIPTSPVSCKVQHEPIDESYSLYSDISTVSQQKFITDAEEVCQSIESVSSTVDPAEDKGSEMSGLSSDTELKGTRINDINRTSILVFVAGLGMICLAIIMSIQRGDDGDDQFYYGLVPT